MQNYNWQILFNDPLFIFVWPFQTSIQFYNKKMLKIIHLACCTGIQTHYLLDMSLLPLPLVQCCQNDIWPRIFVANIKLYAMIVEGRFRRGHYLLFMAIVIQKGGQFPEAFWHGRYSTHNAVLSENGTEGGTCYKTFIALVKDAQKVLKR